MAETPQAEHITGALGYWVVGRRFKAILWLTAALCVFLRTVALSSDAYPRLSWSSGLFTDEAYYLHNARNVVLFGEARQDEWNNVLIMPTLHAVQVGVFRVFGVGIVPARLISVVSSLAMLALLYCAVKRSKPEQPLTALFAVLFLGLDHAAFLYHRMALMDTPGATVLAVALLCFALSLKSEKSLIWAFSGGLTLVLAYTVRGLAAIVFVCPFLALLPSRRENSRQIMATAYGLAVGLVLYLVLWCVPHRQELARYNAYYLHSQLMPHSVAQLADNMRVSLFSWSRGMLPYLIKHTSVVFGLAVWQCGAIIRKKEERDPVAWFLFWWFALFLVLFSVVDYAPSRYFVLFYPAMAVLAGKRLTSLSFNSPPNPPNLGGTLSINGSPQIWGVRGALLLWFLLNGYWLSDWAGHITYKQIEAGRELARELPSESWVFGSVAPGLCIESRLHPVNVIPGLCNGERAIEVKQGQPRYVVILDGKWRQGYWNERYGAIVREENKIRTFRGILRPFFEIGVYKVPEAFGKP